MAGSKKYAELPDLDAAPEIYETPELTDDASTVQTNTLRTDSPSPSEDAQVNNDNFDRARLNRDEARRRFEPAIVDASETNLSGAIGGNRRGYITTHRRRRRRRRDNEGEEYGNTSEESSDEEESLSKKLARLRREAEEVRLELLKREKENEDEEFKDTYEHHENGDVEDDKDMNKGVEELGRVLDSLKTSTRQTNGDSLETEFSKRLEADDTGQRRTRIDPTTVNNTPNASSSISAIAAFADRLSALETALGVSSIPLDSEIGPILPTLSSLSSQMTILTKTIAPTSTATETETSSSSTSYLDEISARLQNLQQESETLLATRKAASQTLASLHDTRNRGSNSSAAFAKYLSKREARERQRDSLTTDGDGDINTNDRPRSTATDQQLGVETATIENRIFSDIFLEEQASKITALYNTLPTIQNLQPLLPVVLERLRGLSVIHASAATAQQDMEDLEARLSQWEADMGKWRDAVEGVERGIEESKVVMKENVKVMGETIRGVERRFDELQSKKNDR